MNSLEAYKKFADNNTLRIYLQAWYLDIACSDGKWDVCYAAKDGEILAIAPYFIKKKVQLSYITMPTLVKYMGPIFSTTVEEKDKQSIVDQMNLMLPSTSYFMQQWQPAMQYLLESGQIITDFTSRDSFIIDITREQKVILAEMNDNYRRSIRKYEEEIVCDLRQKVIREDIELFIDLLEKTMGPLSTHKISKVQLITLIETLEKRKCGKLIFVRYQEDILGASLVSFDENSAYYLFAANNKKFNKLYPGLQTVWQTILFLQKNTAAQELDFLGSSIESIANVWKKLGAKKIQYPLLEKNPSPLFSLLNVGKNLWSKK